MNTVITEKAYAKLNISLDVSRPRPDGYHDMKMIMQSVSLCDDITITLKDSTEISAECNLKYIPGNEKNLAVKAARLYFEAAGIRSGALIDIHKNIPVGAGMAGGSTDAAAVLRALERQFGKPLGKERLLELAAAAGSDVPFCLIGGTALAEGRGEILTPLAPMPDCWFAICKPVFSVSTPELFAALDKVRLRMHPDTDGIINALNEGNLRQICMRMYNVFESVPDRRMKDIAEIKSRMIDAGALGTAMTGTGSAVFGVFTEKEKAEALCPALQNEYGFCRTAQPTGPMA